MKKRRNGLHFNILLNSTTVDAKAKNIASLYSGELSPFSSLTIVLLLQGYLYRSCFIQYIYNELCFASWEIVAFRPIGVILVLVRLILRQKLADYFAIFPTITKQTAQLYAWG